MYIICQRTLEEWKCWRVRTKCETW